MPSAAGSANWGQKPRKQRAKINPSAAVLSHQREMCSPDRNCETRESLWKALTSMSNPREMLRDFELLYFISYTDHV